MRELQSFSVPHLRSADERIGSVPQAEKGPTNVSQLDERRHFMTVAEVAQLMRVRTMTVYRLIKAGELSAIRVGRSYRLRPDAVDRYLGDRYTEAG